MHLSFLHIVMEAKPPLVHAPCGLWQFVNIIGTCVCLVKCHFQPTEPTDWHCSDLHPSCPSCNTDDTCVGEDEEASVAALRDVLLPCMTVVLRGLCQIKSRNSFIKDSVFIAFYKDSLPLSD